MAAQNIVKHMSKEDDNWFYQFSVWKAECDYNTRMSNAEKRGLEKGLQKGLQQGIQQGIQQGLQISRIETAKQLLAMGILSAEQIAQGTGLPIEKVKELQASNK